MTLQTFNYPRDLYSLFKSYQLESILCLLLFVVFTGYNKNKFYARRIGAVKHLVSLKVFYCFQHLLFPSSVCMCVCFCVCVSMNEMECFNRLKLMQPTCGKNHTVLAGNAVKDQQGTCKRSWQAVDTLPNISWLKCPQLCHYITE